MFNFLRTFTIRLFIFRYMARVNIVEVLHHYQYYRYKQYFSRLPVFDGYDITMFDVYSTWSLRCSGIYRHVEIAARVCII